jgi:hypothetical protein
MNDVKKRLSTTIDNVRIRPRWARVLHNLGDDLRWALSAWCDFPRSVGRVAATVLTAATGWVVGADDVVAELISMLQR